MTTIQANSDTGDGIKLEWMNTEHDDVYEVSVFIGYDGVTVVQVDTPANVGRVRINLNDGVVWDGDPDNDEAPGEYRRAWLAREGAEK